MDIAYDHILESSIPDEHGESGSGENKAESSLNADLQEAYRTFSASPWGARIGGFFGSVVKQGESVYREAQQELSAVGQDATRGLTDLRQSIIKHTRSLSLNTSAPPAAAADASSSSTTDPTASKDAASGSGDSNAETTPTATKDLSSEAALQESETVLSRLRGEAAKRLKDLQRAEDAADEALLRFGSNLRDFFRDAIQIAPPTGSGGDGQTGAGGSGSGGGQAGGAVLFESKDAQGKRVIHTSRFDAQLHVIHTSPESFVKDGNGAEFEAWQKEFDVEKKTDDISGDLDKYPELRATMEKLVPDQVAYADFWKRYYFLRHGIETAEARRRDLLKAASTQEEVGWDEDSEEEEEEEEDDDEEAESEPDAAAAPKRPGSAGSSRTIQPPPAAASKELLKPAEPRKSNDEKSQADSEASYDVVGATSGVPSQAPSSPKESRKADDESDEEDEEEDDDEDEDDDDEEDDSDEEDWE